MLGLAWINAGGAVVFGLAYVVAGKGLLSQAAFWTTLIVLFVAVTALWVRAERQQGPTRDLMSRAGRIAIGLALPIIVVPVLVLTPLYFLHDQLPREAGMATLIGRVMFLLLTSLTLMVVVNVAGIAVLVGATLRERLAARASKSRR